MRERTDRPTTIAEVAKGIDGLREGILNSRINLLSETLWGQALCQLYGRESLIEFLQEHDVNSTNMEPAIKDTILSWCQSQVDVYEIKPKGLTELGCSRGEAGDKLGQLIFEEIERLVESGQRVECERVATRIMRPFLLTSRQFKGEDITDSRRLVPGSYEIGKNR